MSDHYLFVIPRDPRSVPTPEVQRCLVERLQQYAPDAEAVNTETTEDIRFFDCGQNFERTVCPRCVAEIHLDWWHARMDEDASGEGFRLDRYAVPCCGANVTLNDLEYHWAQAFGRFHWEVRNPGMAELPPAVRTDLEATAGFALVFVHQHL